MLPEQTDQCLAQRVSELEAQVSRLQPMATAGHNLAALLEKAGHDEVLTVAYADERSQAQRVLLAVHQATAPSSEPAPYVVVAAKDLSLLRDARDYVGMVAKRLGVDNPGGFWDRRDELERIGEASLKAIERLKATD